MSVCPAGCRERRSASAHATGSAANGAATRLAPLGLPPCTLLASPNLALAAPVTPGLAAWPVPIPNDPRLLGVQYYTQSWVPDPSSTFGVGMSNDGESTIGLEPRAGTGTGLRVASFFAARCKDSGQAGVVRVSTARIGLAREILRLT